VRFTLHWLVRENPSRHDRELN
jgi:hypothetical protein